MKRICIVTNTEKDRNHKVTGQVLSICAEYGIDAYEAPPASKDSGYDHILPESVHDDTDAILVLGGDGTLLGTARDTKELGVPLIGINLGNLGYLTEAGRDEIPDAISKLASDEYYQEERMLIQANIIRDGKIRSSEVAFNDAVFARMGQAQITKLNLYINGKLLNSYEADGLIISTPTGSTAYNLSAGGPVVEPTAQMFVVTPICSHVLGLRSVVLSADDILEIMVDEELRHRELPVGVTYDGEPMIRLEPSDRIQITRAEQTVKLLKLTDRSFIDTLRQKMQS